MFKQQNSSLGNVRTHTTHLFPVWFNDTIWVHSRWSIIRLFFFIWPILRFTARPIIISTKWRLDTQSSKIIFRNSKYTDATLNHTLCNIRFYRISNNFTELSHYTKNFYIDTEHATIPDSWMKRNQLMKMCLRKFIFNCTYTAKGRMFLRHS